MTVNVYILHIALNIRPHFGHKCGAAILFSRDLTVDSYIASYIFLCMHDNTHIHHIYDVHSEA